MHGQNADTSTISCQRSLEVAGHKLLVFADYSAKVSRRQKAFATICSLLHNSKVRFTLAYPAMLCITTLDGQQHAFTEPGEAEVFYGSMEEHPEVSLNQRSHSNPVHDSPSRRSPKQKKSHDTPSPRRKRKYQQ